MENINGTYKNSFAISKTVGSSGRVQNTDLLLWRGLLSTGVSLPVGDSQWVSRTLSQSVRHPGGAQCLRPHRTHPWEQATTPVVLGPGGSAWLWAVGSTRPGLGRWVQLQEPGDSAQQEIPAEWGGSRWVVCPRPRPCPGLPADGASQTRAHSVPVLEHMGAVRVAHVSSAVRYAGPARGGGKGGPRGACSCERPVLWAVAVPDTSLFLGIPELRCGGQVCRRLMHQTAHLAHLDLLPAPPCSPPRAPSLRTVSIPETSAPFPWSAWSFRSLPAWCVCVLHRVCHRRPGPRPSRACVSGCCPGGSLCSRHCHLWPFSVGRGSGVPHPPGAVHPCFNPPASWLGTGASGPCGVVTLTFGACCAAGFQASPRARLSRARPL